MAAWRLARSLDTLRNEVRTRWPNTTVWTIGDAAHAGRASDHNPNAQGVVCAIDVVGRSQAAALWRELRASRDPRVAYLIWDGQIVSATTSPWTVRRYTGSNPHRDHIHISVGRGADGRKGRPDLYDDRSGWGIGGTVTQHVDIQDGNVLSWQRDLQRWNPRALPKWGADGAAGEETREWTIRFMRETGLISRNTEPGTPIVGPATRAQMAEALASPEPRPPGPYPDVPGDHTFAEEIGRARDLGLMVGRADGTFGFGQPVTREVLAAVAVRLHDTIKESTGG